MQVTSPRHAALLRLILFVVVLLLATALPVARAASTHDGEDPDFVTDALYDSAVEANRTGDYSRAIRLLTKVIELRPKFADAYRERGFAYLYQGAATEKIEPCTRAILADPIAPDKYLERGNAYFGAGAYDAALGDYNKAAVLRPGDPEPYLRRSRVYLSRGERDKSRTEWDNYMERVKALTPQTDPTPQKAPGTTDPRLT